MNNTVKGRSKKRDRELRVRFSSADSPPHQRVCFIGLGGDKWEERNFHPDGGNDAGIKLWPTLGRYIGKEEFCCDSLNEITPFCLFKRDPGGGGNFKR